MADEGGSGLLEQTDAFTAAQYQPLICVDGDQEHRAHGSFPVGGSQAFGERNLYQLSTSVMVHAIGFISPRVPDGCPPGGDQWWSVASRKLFVCPGVGRVTEDLCWRAFFQDDAVGHEDDAVGDLSREAHFVGDHDHGHAFLGELFAWSANTSPTSSGSSALCDLVEEHRLRLHCQCPWQWRPAAVGHPTVPRGNFAMRSPSPTRSSCVCACSCATEAGSPSANRRPEPEQRDRDRRVGGKG